MIDRKLFQKTFSTLHASPDTLSEVYKVVHKEQKHRHPFSKGMLVGDYLSTVDAAVEADGYTISLKTFLIDENGSGFMT